MYNHKYAITLNTNGVYLDIPNYTTQPNETLYTIGREIELVDDKIDAEAIANAIWAMMRRIKLDGTNPIVKSQQVLLDMIYLIEAVKDCDLRNTTYYKVGNGGVSVEWQCLTKQSVRQDEPVHTVNKKTNMKSIAAIATLHSDNVFLRNENSIETIKNGEVYSIAFDYYTNMSIVECVNTFKAAISMTEFNEAKEVDQLTKWLERLNDIITTALPYGALHHLMAGKDTLSFDENGYKLTLTVKGVIT